MPMAKAAILTHPGLSNEELQWESPSSSEGVGMGEQRRLQEQRILSQTLFKHCAFYLDGVGHAEATGKEGIYQGQ